MSHNNRPTDDEIRSQYVEQTGCSRKQAQRTTIAEMVEALAEFGVEWAVAEVEEYERRHQ